MGCCTSCMVQCMLCINPFDMGQGFAWEKTWKSAFAGDRVGSSWGDPVQDVKIQLQTNFGGGRYSKFKSKPDCGYCSALVVHCECRFDCCTFCVSPRSHPWCLHRSHDHQLRQNDRREFCPGTDGKEGYVSYAALLRLCVHVCGCFCFLLLL